MKARLCSCGLGVGNRRSSAFTLIELLAVISILALLIGILLPALSSARQIAKAKVCLAHLKSIGNVSVIYLNENEERFPPVRLDRPTASSPPEVFYVNDDGRAAPRWQWFLETDLGPVISPVQFTLVQSPMGEFFYDGSTDGGGAADGALQMSIELFTCPILTEDEFATSIRDGAYGYNYQYLGNTYQEESADQWDNFAVGLHSIKSPAKTVMVADSRGIGRRHGLHSFTLDPPRLATEVRARAFGPRTSDFDATSFPGYSLGGLDEEIYRYSPVEARHKNRGNAVFTDGHAEGKTLVEFGYQLGDGSSDSRPEGVPIPIHEPLTETYTASNKLWNGQGSDQIAHKHLPAGAP